MSDTFHQFDARLDRIQRKRRSVKRGGYVAVVNKDGLIVARPTKRRRLPIMGLIYLFAGVVFFKAVLLTQLGAGNYENKVANLQTGSTAEQLGAFVMQADPATVWLSGQLGQFLP